jgi:hypothetical protein
MKQLQPDRQILAMTDTDLEQFVRDWVELKKKDYVEIERFTGPGDRVATWSAGPRLALRRT